MAECPGSTRINEAARRSLLGSFEPPKKGRIIVQLFDSKKFADLFADGIVCAQPSLRPEVQYDGAGTWRVKVEIHEDP